MAALITTAKLNDINPQAWLADVLARIADTPLQNSQSRSRGSGTGNCDHRVGRVNRARNSASDRRKPSSLRTTDFDLFAGFAIRPF
jgi:IS66 C-terminal element